MTNPNLLQRQFTVTRPRKAWVPDLACIRTWQGGLCLAVVKELFSRKIIGGSTSPTIHREFVLDTVPRAVRRRRPKSTVIQSDQGTQCGSDAWKVSFKSYDLEPSMSRTGNRWDTAVAASLGGAGRVWAKEAAKVHHCPGDRWYGKTKESEYMSEADARAKDLKPDHGKSCQ